MSKLIASGNLTTLSEFTDIILMDGMATGAIGFLFTGTFGAGGTVTCYGMKPGSKDKAFRYILGILDPADSSSHGLVVTETGLYYWEGTIDRMVFRLTGNEPGVTDIDWSVFVRTRG